MQASLVYLILGPAGSGRRAILADLIGSGLDATARPLLLTAANEPAPPEAVQQRLRATAALVEARWSPEGGSRIAAAITEGATHVFFLSDGKANPVDQIEQFQAWLAGSGGELARIITVVHAKLGSEHAALLRWYDACVHFSDVVLLNRREGVSNKWVSDFVGRYRKQHLPCLIEFVKNDEVENPARILEPEARRVSQVFDPVEPWADAEDDGDEEDKSGEVTPDDAGSTADPYLERLVSGRRAREIPDIASYL